MIRRIDRMRCIKGLARALAALAGPASAGHRRALRPGAGHALAAVGSRGVRIGDLLRPGVVNLEPLIAGVQARGMCFATQREHPAHRARFAW